MKLKNILVAAIASGSLALFSTCYAKDAGHGHDYRTFHTNGQIEYGQISDSYSSDLVMYLAGNQFMAMEELILFYTKLLYCFITF